VRDHATDGAPEDSRRRAVVKGAAAAGVRVVLLLRELQPLELVAVV
jgi:hypothetical protein